MALHKTNNRARMARAGRPDVKPTPRDEARVRPLRPTMLALLMLSACALRPPAAPAPVVIAPAASPSTDAAPPPDPAIVSVAAVGAPERLVIDGDLAEWGSLLPPIPPSARGAKPAPSPGGGPAPSDPNPRDAASHVALAITGDGARIGAELGEAAREGVWLGIASEPPPVLPVGEYTQVGGSVNEPQMGLATSRECQPIPAKDAPYDPETDPTCQAFRRARAAFEAAHKRRFQRFYRIDREGVRAPKDDGTLAAVEGAKVVFKPSVTGATVEVSLPALALPRLHEAPLSRLRLVARAATTVTPPELTADRWVTLSLPASVGFEPWAELRSRAFGASRWMSYQPGDPSHVEAMRYPSSSNRRSILVSEEPLYVKVATLGDAEIGYLTIAGDPDPGGVSDRVMLTILVKGAISLVPIQGAPTVVVERDAELHVLAYEQWTAPGRYVIGTTSSFADATEAHWSAITVGPDGKHRELALDDLGAPWDDVNEFHEKDSFGMRGLLATWAIAYEKPGQHAELRWRWDRSKKMYVGKRRNIPAPQATKPTKTKP